MKMFKKTNDAGVSPVIATLVLVLVAVAAAVALFAWQSSWQEEQTGNIGDTTPRTTITIGGSSTVYPFTAVAGEAFMAKNPTIEVSFQKGGSGAGIDAVRAGAIDIGSASKDVTPSDDYPDEEVYRIGTDAVVLIVSDSNPHGMLAPAGAWAQADVEDLYDGTFADWGDIVTAGLATIADADGDTVDDPINVYHRSDVSGTEECFCKKMIGKSSPLYNDGQLDETVLVSGATGVPSNQEMIDAIGANNNAIGFASFGIADANDGEVDMLSFGGVAPSSSTIEAGIAGGSGGYSAIRPLNYIVEKGASAEVMMYIEYVLQPEHNIQFCEEVGYFSLY